MPGGIWNRVIAKYGAHQAVGEHLGSVGPERDRGLALCGFDAGIDVRGSLRGVVTQRGEVGVENTCGSGTDGHGGLLSPESAGREARGQLSRQCMASASDVNELRCWSPG